MPRKRSIRNRGRKSKKRPMEIDITSLLDILVILLVFLIKSYNSTNIVLNVPQGVTLPISKSQNVNSAGVMIQVSPTTIWVDDEIIIQRERLPLSYLDMGGRRIIPLYNELRKKIHKIREVEKISQGAQKFSGMVNLIIDKSIKYSYIKKLMFTCAEAGFQKYKFVVLG
ncbi:MAG: biopolymer transporter ExbD, partial [Bacteriovoracaceae bacterium]|nr:biopolymer transporter ExbD [Bacteriovoracaceae bacterium]